MSAGETTLRERAATGVQLQTVHCEGALGILPSPLRGSATLHCERTEDRYRQAAEDRLNFGRATVACT
jgi:hypothetical protein